MLIASVLSNSNALKNSPKNNKERTLQKVKKSISIVSRVASLVVKLRDKPTKADFVSLGLVGLDVGITIYDAVKKDEEFSIQDYLENGEWKKFGILLSDFLMNYVSNASKIADCSNGVIYMGEIGKNKVIYTKKQNHSSPLHYKIDERQNIFDVVRREIWKNENFLTFESFEEINEDRDLLNSNTRETSFINFLKDRTKKFLNKGLARSYLLIGKPGTGKSSSIKFICKNLELKTIRIKLTSFRNGNTFFNFEAFQTMLELSRPDVVIIDDIDRIQDQNSLMYTLEIARNWCKIIFASANVLSKINKALLRPGRFDDVLNITEIEREILMKIIGQDEEYIFQKLKNWPIAYVMDYVDRKRVLGTDVAQEEINQLEKRVEEIGIG